MNDDQPIKKIRKRSGTVVPYDLTKIRDAIARAFEATEPEKAQLAEGLARQVHERLAAEAEKEESWIPEVEQVQDLVEQVLMENDHLATAKAYILYRKQHQELRQVKSLFTDLSAVDNYLDESSWKVKENSNMSYSLQGLNIHLTEELISRYWLERIYPPEIREAHVKGDFHIHDLGTLGPYCVGWDLRDLLLTGFKGVQGKIESSPPNHFRVALMQVVNFMYTLQGEAAGAQAFSNVDTLLAPFISHDDLSYQEVKQAMEEFLFNMNVPTRTGFQTPFTNITLDLTIPEHLRGLPVVIGGELQDQTYGEFSSEVKIFNRAFAEVMLDGDAKGRPFTFPIPTYNITDDFDWDEPMLEPVWKMTAKYGIPYFSNFCSSDMEPSDSRSMCCRLRLDNRELQTRGGGLFGSNPLTGSIGVVTLNLPRIGHTSSSKEEFLSRVEELMDLAKTSLNIKRKTLERFTESGLYPYSRHYLRSIKGATDKFWKNHFSTIGLIGMNDALLNFSGTDIGTTQGKEFAADVLDFMREKLAQYQQETGEMFNLEATPAEGSSYRLARLDRKHYPQIDIFNQSNYGGEEPYYTNSTQLPAGYTDDIFEAIDIQEELQTKYTGGTVFHGFLGESLPDPQATKKLVRAIANNFSIPYYTLTPTFSICPDHGYLEGEQPSCPQCGKSTEVYSRVVGYLRPVQNWNQGKKQEFEDRKNFEKPDTKVKTA